jgi:hypothetical protein
VSPQLPLTSVLAPPQGPAMGSSCGSLRAPVSRSPSSSSGRLAPGAERAVVAHEANSQDPVPHRPDRHHRPVSVAEAGVGRNAHNSVGFAHETPENPQVSTALSPG